MEKTGPEFLHGKYRDLNASPEVASAARRTTKRTDNELPLQNPAARIQNYLDRLKDVLNPSLLKGGKHHADFDRKERNINMLKRALYDEFIIKPDEVPASYFDAIVRRHREEGHGDITIPDDQKKELIEPVIADQKSSLDNWVDYLASDDAKYPDYLKYWAFRSILKMGRYDKEKKKFTERYGGTVSPFPELNQQALALVMDAMERKFAGAQPDFGYDITKEVKQKFLALLQGENFAKLYGLAIEEFRPISEALLKKTDGQWVRYPKGSDPRPLVDSLAPYGTGWCLRGASTAKRYLQGEQHGGGNDLEVFYSADEAGDFTVPRVVIVGSGGRISEVRGVAKQENLDPYISAVVQEKLKAFPDGPAYEKKSRDMQQLTAIERKVKAGQNLGRDDLVFLYEINASIEGFGYQKDPRITELRKERNPEADMLVIFACTKDQIAHLPSEIKETTKAYVGQLEPGIFQKLPEHLEHVYTSFPDKKIRREQVAIGGKSAEQLIREMKATGINIANYAKSMLKNREFVPGKNPEEVTLIRLTVADLGFKTGATTDQIFARAQELGLELCPPDAGPHYRLQYQNQPVGEWVYVGMKQISAPDGGPSVFLLVRYEDGLWLDSPWAGPDHHWLADDQFVFRLRKSEV